MRGRVVAVLGASRPSAAELNLAREVGALLAERGAVVVTGGLGGVMAAASEGAREKHGLVIGILPGVSASDANSHVGLAIPTGLGDARNAVIANCAEGFVAIGGGLGTLSEIAFALKRGKPVVGVSTWKLDHRRLEGVAWHTAHSPAEAIETLWAALSSPQATLGA